MNGVDRKVLVVLAGQASDYLIHPDATAFAVEALDEKTVSASLARLAAAGLAAESEVVQMTYADDGELVELKDDKGNAVQLAEGWAITPAGAKLIDAAKAKAAR